METPMLGLFTLYPPTGSDVIPLLDIVLVHGIDGHYRDTWKADDETIWPIHLLPKKMRAVRIMSFGYRGTYNDTTSLATNYDHGLNLFNLLRDEREATYEEGRPIIFIGHSLGGIIIKQMLLVTNDYSQSRPEARKIFESTYGVIFFSTPHNGIDAKTWEQFVQLVVKNSKPDEPKDAPFPSKIIDAIRHNSNELVQLSQSFRLLQDIAYVSFWEQFETPKLGAQLVTKQSATMGLDHEEIRMLPKSHFDICRFRGDDEGFKQVLNVIKNIQKNSPKTEKIFGDRSRVLESLRLDDLRTNLQEMKHTENTCGWITDRKEFRSWQDPSPKNSKLWILGELGCGKTYLAKYIAKKAIQPGHIVAQCFLDEISEKQRTCRTILLVLLHEVLMLCPQLIDNFKTKLDLDSLKEKPQEDIWDLGILKNFLPQVMIEAATTRPLTLIIDGLDHCEDGTEAIFECFALCERSVTKPGHFKLLVASRECSALFSYSSRFKFIVYRITKMDTEADIRATVRDCLESIAKNMEYNSELKNLMYKKIPEGANGMYLWARIMADEVKLAAFSEDQLRSELARLPRGIIELYDRILGRIGQRRQQRDFVRIVLFWTAFRHKVLKTKELRVGMAISALTADRGTLDISEETIKNFLPGCNIPKTVVRLCGHLIKFSNGKVNLVHESLKRFLTTPTEEFRQSFREVQHHEEYFFREADAHKVICDFCVAYLLLSPFKDSGKPFDPSDPGPVEWQKKVFNRVKKHDFVVYAALSWVAHARMSGEPFSLEDNWDPYRSVLLDLQNQEAICWTEVWWYFRKKRLNLQKYPKSELRLEDIYDFEARSLNSSIFPVAGDSQAWTPRIAPSDQQRDVTRLSYVSGKIKAGNPSPAIIRNVQQVPRPSQLPHPSQLAYFPPLPRPPQLPRPSQIPNPNDLQSSIPMITEDKIRPPQIPNNNTKPTSPVNTNPVGNADKPPFTQFKAKLRNLIHPPTTLQEALNTQHLKTIRKLLEKQFHLVAKDNYAWLYELHEAGYSWHEMAELLLEEADYAPWIPFDPSQLGHADIQRGTHLPRCVHQLNTNNSEISLHDLNISTADLLGKNEEVKRAVQELCGLAGFSPMSWDTREWNGDVEFDQGNTHANVCYTRRVDEESDFKVIVSRITKALEGFYEAFGHIQQSGLCCDSFTILVNPTPTSLTSASSPNPELPTPPQVELWRVDLRSPLQLREELKYLSILGRITQVETANYRNIAQTILEPLLRNTSHQNVDSGDNVDYTLHLCALAVQFLCLGLLSYSQAHVGAIHPFFLDTPQRSVLLRGTTGKHVKIVARLNDLTCFGDMLKERPVLTFSSIIQLTPGLLSTQYTPKYDLLASPEDILDTWGPGKFVFRKDRQEKPCAISVGGGVIYAIDDTAKTFHWSLRDPLDSGEWQMDLHDKENCRTEFGTAPYSVSFEPHLKVVVGTLVTVNETCSLDEEKCWSNCYHAMQPLGTSGPYWKAAERQGGMQAGFQYVFANLNQTWAKDDGKTLKQMFLDYDDIHLISFLECRWGLQVSFCTGVAKRVLLRQLVADVIPLFARRAISFALVKKDVWEDLVATNIVGKFQNQRLADWYPSLTPDHRKVVLGLVCSIIRTFRETGLDRDGNLVIAWPREHDVYQCFKVPCEKQSYWARILADSKDSATFSYVSTKCLVSSQAHCSGPTWVWRNVSTMLGTAVLPPMTVPKPTEWVLHHGERYFIGTRDSLVHLSVHMNSGNGSTSTYACLITKPMNVPEHIKNRLLNRKWQKGEGRLRERRDDLQHSVDVLVLNPEGFSAAKKIRLLK
ncbi:hypothetical protein BDZ45DRAFT_379368 [Acephala macrosclerotiorum]|nr:hypothetical protein BDZ45DRAFT_379368 [Acephala macrosclerotiorum]